jgi:hypothetical protein
MTAELHRRLLEPHKATAGDYHEWVMLGGHRWLDATGGRRGTGWLWIDLTCNNVSCNAIPVVREDSLVAIAAEGHPATVSQRAGRHDTVGGKKIGKGLES